MNWQRLKENKCPKCKRRSMLLFSPDGMKLYCPCGFSISEQRMKEVLSGIVTQEMDEEDYATCACGMPKIACKCWE